MNIASDYFLSVFASCCFSDTSTGNVGLNVVVQFQKKSGNELITFLTLWAYLADDDILSFIFTKNKL